MLSLGASMSTRDPRASRFVDGADRRPYEINARLDKRADQSMRVMTVHGARAEHTDPAGYGKRPL